MNPFSHYLNEAVKAIDLDPDLYPAIDCEEDVQIGDSIVPVYSALTLDTQHKRWTVAGFETDKLLIQEESLALTYAYPLNFNEVRLNPYGPIPH